MKSTGLIIIAIAIMFQAEAQTWKVQVERISGNSRTKTLRIKPAYNLTVGSILTNKDSIKEYRYYEGLFNSGCRDSIGMKLSLVRDERIFSNGISENTKHPGKSYLASLAQDTDYLKIPLSDISYLEYQNQELGGWAELGEPIMLLSILTMVAAPFICYDFKNGNLNADRYKYWAVGSSIGIATGFATVFTFATLSNHKKLKFNENWKSKGKNVWRFK